MNHLDLHTFIGAGGAPAIEQTVQILKVQFKLPVWITPYLAAVFSLAEQIGLGFYFHYGVESMLWGLGATLLAVFTAHEITSD